MVKILKFLLYFIIFIFGVLYFSPKISAYYFLEQNLKQEKVVISEEKLQDKGFVLALENLKISYEDIPSVDITEAKISLFLFYNRVEIKDITLNKMLASFAPLHIKSVNIRYTIMHPLTVLAKAEGDFGVANATFSLKDEKLKVFLKPSKKMLRGYQNSLREMKKNKKGEYLYEQSIK